MKRPLNLVLFISGTGSNARNIVDYFAKHEHIAVLGIISSKENSTIKEYCVDNQLFYAQYTPWDEHEALHQLTHHACDLIILAGFLKKISALLISQYPNRILNIHPSLLPKFGGAGMYGRRVHEAVHARQEAETGITIHLVNEYYDEGRILEQHRCSITTLDSIEQIEEKVHELEYQCFPPAIERYCLFLKG
jgi:phosphoribosylglycinamide formyltransferase-1